MNAPRPKNPRSVWTACCWIWLGLCSLGGGCALHRETVATADVVTGRQLILRGIEATQRQEWQQAEEYFRDAASAAPQDERAHFQYAQALWRKGDRQTALTHMMEAVRLSAGHPELLVALGRMQLSLGDGSAAEASARRALDADRHYPPAYALLGDVASQRGQLDKALEHYHRSLSLQPQNPEVQLAVARIYRARGEHRRSLSTVQSITSRELPPEFQAQLLSVQGVAERELGRLEDAEASLRRATELAPSLAEVWYELAATQMSRGNLLAARMNVRHALALDANHAPSLALLHQLERAVQVADAAVSPTDKRQNR